MKTCVAVWFLTLCGNPGLPVDAREVLPPSSFAAGPVSEQEDPPESGSADNDGTPGDGERVYGTYRLIDWQARLSSLDPKSTEALDSIPALIAIISDARLPADVRRPFAVTLGRIGVPARDAIPVLIAQIEQRHQLKEPTYIWAARTLGFFGYHARQAAPALTQLLFDESIPVTFRQIPIEALAKIGSAHPAVLPALIRLLQYRPPVGSKVSAADASVFRELAAEALGIMGPDGDLAVPLLVRIVRDRQEAESVRRKALVALGKMRSRAALAIPAIIETIEFERSVVLRDGATQALAGIGMPASTVMRHYLAHRDPGVRACMAQAFGLMKEAAVPVVPDLMACLADPDAAVRVTVCESLRSMEVAPRRFGRPLVELLESDDRQVQMRAMRLMVSIGRPLEPFSQQLHVLQEDTRSSVSTLARKVLKAIESDRSL